MAASHERADGREDHIKNVEHLLVHPACRKLYTRQNSISSYLRSKSITPGNTENKSEDEPYIDSQLGPRLKRRDICTDCIHCDLPAVDSRRKGIDQAANRVYSCQSVKYIEKLKRDVNCETMINSANISCYV